MKCFACDGSGVETCFHCDGQGECSYCKGEGRQSCPLCDGSGEEPHPDSFSEKRWARVPWPIRKIVEQHVAAHLPVEILEKLRDLHARGVSISTDPAFFHFGGGMTVRNLCRERPVTTSWQPAAAWAPIGTPAMSACSPLLPRYASSGDAVFLHDAGRCVRSANVS